MVAFNSPSPRLTASGSPPDCPDSLSPSQIEARHDAILVDRFRRGDEAAFTEIVGRYQKKMFTVAFARLRNHADAEEIAQDTFLRAHRALANFRGESSLSTWLHRIVTNLALNRYWYFFRRRRHLTQSLDQPLTSENTATLADVFASEAPGPVHEVMTSEFTQLAAECAQQLTPQHGEILRLRSVLDRSYEEIAAMLGLKVGTVKSRIARARDSLHALIAKTCPDFVAEASAAEWLSPMRTGAA